MQSLQFVLIKPLQWRPFQHGRGGATTPVVVELQTHKDDHRMHTFIKVNLLSMLNQCVRQWTTQDVVLLPLKFMGQRFVRDLGPWHG